MKLLITGICGFAGSVLARTLLEHREGLSLVGLDNLSRKGSETNVEPLRALGIDVRIGDVRDRAFLDAMPPADWILDCAANPSVLAGVDGSGSRDLIDQNLYGTVNLLEMCKVWSAGFTLLSTSRVYSIPPLASLPLRESPTRFEPDFQPQKSGRENASADSDISLFRLSTSTFPTPPGAMAGFSPLGVNESFSTAAPVSLYGSTKLCSEWLALEYGSAFGFPVWINRCGVLAGGGQFGKADQGIFSYWIHSWKAGHPLRYIGFAGTGKQVRDCLHPRDIVPVLLKQMGVKGRVSSVESPQTVNLSGGVENSMSLLELSAWCQDRFGPHPNSPALNVSAFSFPPSTSLETRPYDIPWLVLDPSRAGEAWHWHPATPIYDVLEEIALHAEANPRWLDLVT